MGTLASPVALPPIEEVRVLTLAVHRKRIFIWGKRLATFLEQIYTSSKTRVLTSAAQRTRDPFFGERASGLANLPEQMFSQRVASVLIESVVGGVLVSP